jgi:uncharacterized protein (TIGR00290 family)
MSEKILLSWSGGKDSAYSLFELKRKSSFEIVALLTTVTEDYDRVSMHGVRRVLLEQQAESLGVPLEIVWISKNASNQEYESKMQTLLERYRNVGVSTVAFGDIFLEDLRKYRESNLAKIGMKGLFPLWKRDTTEMARSFIAQGFRAVITCVDTQALEAKYVGRSFDEALLRDLPAAIDRCGENGEFHSFVYDGPIFRKKINHALGEVTLRDNRFCFCDLVLEEVN